MDIFIPLDVLSSRKAERVHPVSCQGCLQEMGALGFPGGAVVENLPANAGDMGSSPGLGRSHMPRSD